MFLLRQVLTGAPAMACEDAAPANSRVKDQPMLERYNYVTIYDLVHALPNEEILEACRAVDPKCAHRYPQMLAELQRLAARRTIVTAVIRLITDDDGSTFIDVSGEMFGNPGSYAIAFLPWAEWLGSTFRVDGLDLSPAQILAQCLNEMS